MDTSRNWLFIDESNQKSINKIKVLFAGCGLGSYIATSLARMGVENFILADGDTVSESNLNRQYYDDKDIGLNKADTLARILKEINPNCKVTCLPIFLNKDHLEKLIPQVDIVINAIDFDSEEFLICNELVKNYKKIEIFSVNLGFGATTLVFDSTTPDLREFFKEKDFVKIKGKMLDWIAESFADPYLKERYELYKTMKVREIPEPQLVVGALLNSAFTCKIIRDICSGNKVKCMPDSYSHFI